MSEQPNNPLPPGQSPEPVADSTPLPPPAPGQSPEPVADSTPPPPPAPGPAPAWAPPESPSPTGVAAIVADRPEIAVGAAFAGGLVLALILKRLAR